MTRTYPSDAAWWAEAVGGYLAAGHDLADAERRARRDVAEVRRARTTIDEARTFGPGEPVPYDVVRAYDLDGDVWERLGADPSRRDMWRMPNFDPDEYESAAGGVYLTPQLLDAYGPLTALPAD